MKKFLINLWKDEEGAETVEYVLIAAALTGIALAVYVADDGLQGGLTTLVGEIVDAFPDFGPT